MATALGINIDAVTVRDDPIRHYGVARNIPGDLIEVTTDEGHWCFIPDLSGFDPLWTWLMLGECPECHAPQVPVVRVATLADLGEYYLGQASDPHGKPASTAPGDSDPGHHRYCPRACPDTETVPTANTGRGMQP